MHRREKHHDDHDYDLDQAIDEQRHSATAQAGDRKFQVDLFRRFNGKLLDRIQSMISVSWLKKRQPYWARLESLLGDITRHGLHALGRDELRELGLLYRQTATDLSAVRGDPSSVQQSRYLNQLLGRAHNTDLFWTEENPGPDGALLLERVSRNLSPISALHPDRHRQYSRLAGWLACL